jgi:nitrite reductase/ring-hydroxylating ferredoxin subunit
VPPLDPVPRLAQYEPVVALADLPRHGMRACLIGGREVVICRTREGVFALDNICTHAQARLSEGRLRRERLVCPLHGAAFDIHDGRVLAPPAEAPLTTYPVRLHDGVVEIALTAVSIQGPTCPS